MIPLDSACLAAVEYDVSTRILRVQFCSGPKVYSFYGVPRHKFQGLLAAPSHGEYFHAHIKGRYGPPGHAPEVFTRPHPDYLRMNPT